MKIQYKKTHPLATFNQATHGSSGFDLTACSIVDNGTQIKVNFGVTVAIPKNHVGLLVPRSSTPNKYNVLSPHGVGIIDSDYRGELMGIYTRVPNVTYYRINPADRIAQLIIVPSPEIIPQEVDIISDYVEPKKPTKKRRTGGIGSTDKQLSEAA